jgi:hypothetical protein
LAIFMFALSGVPPTAGFFGKLSALARRNRDRAIALNRDGQRDYGQQRSQQRRSKKKGAIHCVALTMQFRVA